MAPIIPLDAAALSGLHRYGGAPFVEDLLAMLAARGQAVPDPDTTRIDATVADAARADAACADAACAEVPAARSARLRGLVLRRLERAACAR